MWKTLATRGSVAPESDDELASSSWPTIGAGLGTAAPESFAEPAALGWLATPSCSEAAAPGFGNGALAGAGSSGT
jgi:hypothetical protein